MYIDESKDGKSDILVNCLSGYIYCIAATNLFY